MTLCSNNFALPTKSEKACSGKCRGGCPTSMPRLWVIAACNGMVSLFRQETGELIPISSEEATIFPSLDAFSSTLKNATEHHAFDQLMVVGTQSDIAWLHMSVPEEVTARIVAEIQYPLLAGWFADASVLSSALKRVVMP